MKSIVIMFALILVFGISQTVFAQSEAEALITASVENALTLVNVDGDWGVMAPGTTYVITPGGFKEPPGPGEGAGIVVGPVGFEIDGNSGATVVVTLVLPSGLQSDDGNGQLPLSNWTFGWNYDNDPTVAFAASGPIVGSAVTVGLGGGGESSTGLFIGATVTVPQTAFAGSYTAQLIGSAAYTGN